MIKIFQIDSKEAKQVIAIKATLKSIVLIKMIKLINKMMKIINLNNLYNKKEIIQIGLVLILNNKIKLNLPCNKPLTQFKILCQLF